MKRVGETLAVSALVVDDGDALVLEMFENVFGGDFGLLVVPAAGAQNIGQAALGEVRRRGRSG